MRDYAHLKTLLAPFGELRSQPASAWSGNGPLHADIAQFYEQVGPWGEVVWESVGPVGLYLEVGGNPVCIPPLHKLHDLQAGYAWSHTPATRLPEWHDSWLVVAEQGGDPFIFDQDSREVLFDFHGNGQWRPQIFATSLVTAFGAIATVARAYGDLDESEFVDCEPTAAALAGIRNRLADFLGPESDAADMLKVWEYFS